MISGWDLYYCKHKHKQRQWCNTRWTTNRIWPEMFYSSYVDIVWLRMFRFHWTSLSMPYSWSSSANRSTTRWRWKRDKWVRWTTNEERGQWVREKEESQWMWWKLSSIWSSILNRLAQMIDQDQTWWERLPMYSSCQTIFVTES